MAQRPSPPPSPQARRQAHVLSLRQALSKRDRAGVDGLVGQWVHRHGVDGLEPLLQELEREDPEGLSWWRLGAQELEEADSAPEPAVIAEPVVAESEPTPEELAPEPMAEPAPEPVVAADPAPAIAPPAPLPMPQEAVKRSIRPRPAASRPAPAPSHPALAELRSWLPSAGESRAA
ncbi:hypothetical protein [Synechococcus sp. LTW-R]|uniref:hypothetical protein n=1 Tax=Synechococcus sp. LTW-R TaxID=2751170 RepID=UPI0016281745|nr:hypothetical protein [Synechococcus sp. LTW-R]QNG30703.1 hypothetical protein H0O22_06430 [Synechococcus sp. LTW-R]